MKSFSGLSVNVFVPPSTTADAGPFAELLGAMLKKAGWKVGSGTSMGGWARYVLVCTGENPKPNVEVAAEEIARTLQVDGIITFIDPKLGPYIPLTGVGIPLKSTDMTILVGSRQ
jgi:hypothetical protein